MGFNADGTPDDGSSFTQPGGLPVKKPPRPTGQGGWAQGTGDPTNGYGEGSPDLGKARPWDGSGRGSGAYGGYAGTYVDDGNGGVRYDAGLNGRQEAVDRARSLGEQAANRGAYQIDYGQADRFAAAGQADRGFQTDALNLAGQTARGQNLQSQALGQQMLQQGVQAQQAGAASTRGGSLAQAAAMRQQAAGQGAYMQQGNTMLAGQRAAEMAQGRDAYMQQATGLRASDAQAQGLNQQQGIQQMQQELGQRQLNQAGQMGFEAQGQAVNKSAADGALKAAEINAGIDSAASLRATQQADRQQQQMGAMAAAGGALMAKGADAFTSMPSTSGGDDGGMDPYSKAVSNSDARGKTRITSLGAAAMGRRPR